MFKCIVQLAFIVWALTILSGCDDLQKFSDSQQEAYLRSQGYDTDKIKREQVAHDADKQLDITFADSDQHPEKYQLDLTKDEESILKQTTNCGDWVQSCLPGERDRLQQVTRNYYAMILCQNKKIDLGPCSNTNMGMLYNRILTTAQKRDFIDNLVVYYKQLQADTAQAENEHMKALKTIFDQEFKGQYQAVKITNHYFEQEDKNFPQIDPLMGINAIEQSPNIQTKDECVASLKQSIKKRWWDGLMHGGKQLSDNTIVAPLGDNGMLVQEKYICVPVVENEEIRSLIHSYEEEIRKTEMGLGIGAASSVNEFAPSIPGL